MTNFLNMSRINLLSHCPHFTRLCYVKNSPNVVYTNLLHIFTIKFVTTAAIFFTTCELEMQKFSRDHEVRSFCQTPHKLMNRVTATLTLTLTLSPDPNRYRRRCPDPNARIQKSTVHTYYMRMSISHTYSLTCMAFDKKTMPKERSINNRRSFRAVYLTFTFPVEKLTLSIYLSACHKRNSKC